MSSSVYWSRVEIRKPEMTAAEGFEEVSGRRERDREKERDSERGRGREREKGPRGIAIRETR